MNSFVVIFTLVNLQRHSVDVKHIFENKRREYSTKALIKTENIFIHMKIKFQPKQHKLYCVSFVYGTLKEKSKPHTNHSKSRY